MPFLRPDASIQITINHHALSHRFDAFHFELHSCDSCSWIPVVFHCGWRSVPDHYHCQHRGFRCPHRCRAMGDLHQNPLSPVHDASACRQALLEASLREETVRQLPTAGGWQCIVKRLFRLPVLQRTFRDESSGKIAPAFAGLTGLAERSSFRA